MTLAHSHHLVQPAAVTTTAAVTCSLANSNDVATSSVKAKRTTSITTALVTDQAHYSYNAEEQALFDFELPPSAPLQMSYHAASCKRRALDFSPTIAASSSRLKRWSSASSLSRSSSAAGADHGGSVGSFPVEYSSPSHQILSHPSLALNRQQTSVTPGKQVDAPRNAHQAGTSVDASSVLILPPALSFTACAELELGLRFSDGEIKGRSSGPSTPKSNSLTALASLMIPLPLSEATLAAFHRLPALIIPHSNHLLRPATDIVASASSSSFASVNKLPLSSDAESLSSHIQHLSTIERPKLTAASSPVLSSPLSSPILSPVKASPLALHFPSSSLTSTLIQTESSRNQRGKSRGIKHYSFLPPRAQLEGQDDEEEADDDSEYGFVLHPEPDEKTSELFRSFGLKDRYNTSSPAIRLSSYNSDPVPSSSDSMLLHSPGNLSSIHLTPHASSPPSTASDLVHSTSLSTLYAPRSMPLVTRKHVGGDISVSLPEMPLLPHSSEIDGELFDDDHLDDEDGSGRCSPSMSISSRLLSSSSFSSILMPSPSFAIGGNGLSIDVEAKRLTSALDWTSRSSASSASPSFSFSSTKSATSESFGPSPTASSSGTRSREYSISSSPISNHPPSPTSSDLARRVSNSNQVAALPASQLFKNNLYKHARQTSTPARGTSIPKRR